MRLSVKIALGGLLSLVTLISRAQDIMPTADLLSDTPTSTATASLTSTLSTTPTYTVSLEPNITEMDTATSVSTLTPEFPSPTLSATLEFSTVEVTPETTSDLPTAFFTLTPIDQLLTETVEAAVTLPTLTLTPSVSPTVTLAPSPTETVGSLMMVAGNAVYQNHSGDNSRIEISVFDADDNLIGVTQTDVNGAYSLNIPGQHIYQLVMEAALHRRIQLVLTSSEKIPDVVLEGGDLDADGCIGQLDLDLFMGLFTSLDINQADITGDGIIDASDFAIVAGNYQNSCVLIEPTPIASLVPVSPMPSPTIVESVTPQDLLSTPTEAPTLVDLALTPGLASTLVIESTMTPSPESTLEGT